MTKYRSSRAHPPATAADQICSSPPASAHRRCRPDLQLTPAGTASPTADGRLPEAALYLVFLRLGALPIGEPDRSSARICRPLDPMPARSLAFVASFPSGPVRSGSIHSR
uniref:Uncharacterized protein n=1 Tax=Arundo donax TaxID=35708 RepID=A0A0A9GN17_ARUDO